MTDTIKARQGKVTYTSADADMDAFHRSFDEALGRTRSDAGGDHPLFIDNEPVAGSSESLVDTSPIDTSLLLGRFAAAAVEHIDQAVRSARTAQRVWGRTPWADRVKVLRRAAALVRERKFDIGAIMSLEVGKSRMEAMGDVEESADLIDYYCAQIEEHDGFTRPLGQLLPNEKTRDVLRPYGVFVCIAPFNFPMALSTGMSSAALAAGNAVIYKPSRDAPWTGLKLYEVYRDAGLPAGLFNFVTGEGTTIGEALWKHPGVDGIVFTGSKAVGMRMFREFSRDWPKPVLMELGGKNPAVVCESADIGMAAEGIAKSAFGLQGQKCSACSRVYADERIYDALVEKLISTTADLTIGDPTEKGVFFGPVINDNAVRTFVEAVAVARREGRILHGGMRLTDGAFAKGRYVAPTIAELPLEHELFRRELFVPFLAVAAVSGLDHAIAECNRAEYGLTAGIFSARREEIDQFFDQIEAGVCYANRRSGATTGAWPGVQSFTGWKGSGSTGKGGCGPYYVAQFMREQSRTIME